MGKLGQTDLHMPFRNNPLLLTLPVRLVWKQTERIEDLQSPVLRQGWVLAREFWGLLGEPSIRTLLAQHSGLLGTLPPHSFCLWGGDDPTCLGTGPLGMVFLWLIWGQQKRIQRLICLINSRLHYCALECKRMTWENELPVKTVSIVELKE